MTIHEKIFGIKEFKKKCLHEFPLILKTYSPEYMQLPLDEITLQHLLNTQINRKGEEYLMRALYQDITKNRLPYEIKSTQKKLIIQNNFKIILDLEKTYFIFKDKIFRITATTNLMEKQIEEPTLSMFFNLPVYSSYTVPADANIVIQNLHKYIICNSTLNDGFSITIEWGHKQGWGSADLISSISFENNTITNIELVDNPFLLFNNNNVLIDLLFF